MKKNDWILTSAVAAYSTLFYKQTAGINFLIFNLTVIILLAIKDKNLLKQTNWRWAALTSIISAFCIAYYGNSLSVIANIISLSILSGLSVNATSSVILSLLFSFYSYFSSPVFMYLNWEEKKQKKAISQSNNSSKKLWLVLIPLLITLLFFFMYRASNPLFNEFAKKINFDFISWNWITFTIGGFILLYGFFYHQKINYLAELDEQSTNNLEHQTSSSFTLFGKNFTIEEEFFSGKILFLLLNSLLLILNALDINFLFFGGKLPQGITYSQYVHQGIEMLICSIIIAIAIILFYFRAALNFYEKNKTIKLLAYLWIIQNAFMLVSTAVRNNMYVVEYGLTYKRIGVYVYLLLALIGLFTVVIKVMKAKSNIYLFRINGWIFYVLLIVSCLFNWDWIITDYNIKYSKNIEESYLISLSDTNLPLLVELDDNFYKKQLSWKLYWFLYNHQNIDFRSWYYNNTGVYDNIVYLNTHNKIKEIRLSHSGIKSLTPLKTIHQINEMDISYNAITSLKELKPFKNLKKLNVRDNKLSSLEGIEELKNLEFLTIVNTNIDDYYQLYGLKKLKEVSVSYSIDATQLEQLKIKLPNTLFIKQ